MNKPQPAPSVSELLVDRIGALRAESLPAPVRERAGQLLIDIVGLCIAARATDYVRSVLTAADTGGGCTAIGHASTYDAGTAALINGTAAHGEDFDDTFEGGPVHSSVVIIPAVLAACERFHCDGRAA